MVGMKRGAGRTNDPDGLRGRILDAALACFQRSGYAGANMREVMRAAATTSGALHHHFPTKKDLARAVLLERVAREVEETWTQAVRSAPTALDGVAAVFASVAADLDRKQRIEGCPVNNLTLELALVDDDFRAPLNAIFAAWRRAIAEKAAADGGRAGATMAPDDLALMAVAQFSGAMAMAKAAQSARPLEDSARLFRQLAGAGGAARPAAAHSPASA